MRHSLILLCLVLVCAPAALAATYTVTTTADSGPGSLRQAILDANATPGVLDNIHFNIAPGGPQVIPVVGSLPLITDAVVIDGTTQPGFTGTPIITLDGSSLSSSLRINTTARSTVRGLVIIDFTGGFGNGGIIVSGSGGALIAGNYIGVDASGMVARGNADAGIRLEPTSQGSIIGGPSAADRNVISGNLTGISIGGLTGSGASNNNVVQGNIIGLDAAASNALPNTSFGITIEGGDNNQILGNVISGNGLFGIGILTVGLTELARSNVVQGNLIGTNGAGNAARPNAIAGVGLSGAQGTIIGGSAPGARNTISGNAGSGIAFILGLSDVTMEDNVIEGNFIGTDSSGAADLGNGTNGISVTNARNNTIAGNVVSGNGGNGIALFGSAGTAGSTSNVVRGNRIGTDASGTTALPNDVAGIFFAMPATPSRLTGNTIGGTAAGEGNTIRFNGSDGIAVLGGVGNRFLGNSIDLNTGLGIDLGDDGVTPNDAGDADTGPNNRQNYPVLTAANVTGTTSVTGTLNSTPARTFRIEFFSSPAVDPSGFGEGRVFLGFTNVTTDAGGNAAIAATVPAVAAGTVITSTATDLTTNDTSEFSNAVAPIVATPNVSIGDTTIVEPDAGTENATFTVTLTSPSATDVTFQYATANGTATAPGDYTATSGTGVIPAGSLSTTILVPVVGDQVIEPDETFVVNITGVTGAIPTDTQGQATIINEDAAGIPTLSEWALLLMALLLAAGGAVVMRR